MGGVATVSLPTVPLAEVWGEVVSEWSDLTEDEREMRVAASLCGLLGEPVNQTHMLALMCT